MRFFTLALLSAVALLRSCSGRGSVEPVTQSTGARFRDAIGVNLHLQYAATRYHDVGAVARALDYLGVTHVRDGGFRRGDEAFASYVQLARRGVGFDLFLNADLPSQLQRVDRFAHAAPGALDALEGPNEVNNDPVIYGGSAGVAGAQAYQAALFQKAKADPVLRDLPILNYTNWPPTGGRADAVNFHSYPKRGVTVSAQLTKDDALAGAALPAGYPRYLTEIGFPASESPYDQLLTPQEQADRLLVSLLEAFRSGIRRVYIYELFDEEQLRIASEAHYGLLTAKGEPKLTAIYLHNLISWLPRRFEPARAASDACTSVAQDLHCLCLAITPNESMTIFWNNIPRASISHISFRVPRTLNVRELDLDSGTLLQGLYLREVSVASKPRVFIISSPKA